MGSLETSENKVDGLNSGGDLNDVVVIHARRGISSTSEILRPMAMVKLVVGTNWIPSFPHHHHHHHHQGLS
jgi:hypothetical protein